MTNRESNKRPIAIDLFAGAGGMSLGFEQAGFDVKCAVEIDPVHCATHKFNFPDTAVIPKSVSEITGSEIRLASGIGNEKIACVVGGAPCQGFSMIGKRVLDDPRNNLVLDFVRLVTELDAESFVFENVKGLTLGKHKKFIDDFIEEFKCAGYEILLPWEVLNAADYGVPQNRERLFILGVKQGLKIPLYPVKLNNRVTCDEAIGDLPNAELFESLKRSDKVKTHRFKSPSDYAAEMRCIDSDSWHFGYPRNWQMNVLTSSARTNHTDISRNRFSETNCGKVEPISRFYKLDSNGQSNTLRAGTDSKRGAFTSPRPIHYKYNRCVSVREMARLHGFPDWFRLHSTKWHGARQIGNAVPPPLARAVASEIVIALGISLVKPNNILELGSERLLYKTVTQAAEYFNVRPPAQKRDRKSHYKKRKQEDIELLRKQYQKAANVG